MGADAGLDAEDGVNAEDADDLLGAPEHPPELLSSAAMADPLLPSVFCDWAQASAMAAKLTPPLGPNS